MLEQWKAPQIKESVLIVDDVSTNRIILQEILKNDYDVVEAEDGESTLRYLSTEDELPQAILLDIVMPGMDGFSVLRQIRSEPKTAHIPVLFITAADAEENETRGLIEGAVDYITKPFNPGVVKARLDNQIQLARYRSSLEQMVKQKTQELIHTHETLLETLATIIEYRSLESGAHVRRTCEMSRLLVQKLLQDPAYEPYLSQNSWESMIKAVSLHDIGKVGVPDSILLKDGPLTPEEFEVIKRHSEIGANIIDTIAASVSDDVMYLHHCRNICRYHHERWDGKGYPLGLKGEEIPLSARIVSVVDVYDALVNKRCYKPSFPHGQAMQIIMEGAGTQFDPGLIRAFESIHEDFYMLQLEMPDPEILPYRIPGS